MRTLQVEAGGDFSDPRVQGDEEPLGARLDGVQPPALRRARLPAQQLGRRAAEVVEPRRRVHHALRLQRGVHSGAHLSRLADHRPAGVRVGAGGTIDALALDAFVLDRIEGGDEVGIDEGALPPRVVVLAPAIPSHEVLGVATDAPLLEDPVDGPTVAVGDVAIRPLPDGLHPLLVAFCVAASRRQNYCICGRPNVMTAAEIPVVNL